MKVCVTGASGFVGSHLAEALVREGYAVKAIAQASSDISLLEKLDVEIFRGDIADGAAVEKAVGGCSHVYHLAAKTSRARAAWRDYDRVNVLGAETVARAALKAGVERVVFCSSAGVYGAIRRPPVDEHTKPSPNSHYRRSKLLGEQVLMDYYKKERVPVVIARIGSVFGPRSLNWLGLFQSIASGRFRLKGKGENHVHLGYVSDIVRGLRLCGEKPGIDGECFLIAGTAPISLRDWVDMIAEELGIAGRPASVTALPYRAFHVLAQLVYQRLGVELPYAHRAEFFLTDNIFDISKARRDLGYAPSVSTAEGTRWSIQWCREKGYMA
jgi:nucleoside-diphosphate-sugar epimerase